MKLKQCSVCKQFVPLWKSKPPLCKNCVPKTPIKSRRVEVNISDLLKDNPDADSFEFKLSSNKAITAPKKSKAIPKVSQKQLERLKAYKKVRDAFMKEHEYCQAQLEGICLGKATDTHHSKGKVGDLLTDVRYFFALCRACHSKIEVSPTLAKELGFSLNRLDK